MESSIFAKLILFLASILGLVTNPVYIELGAASLTFDYKTGQDPQIIRYLSVKNIGSQKARFVISSSVPWISLAREGTGFEKSANLETQTAVNFVLTIQTRDVADGSNNAEITVDAQSADIFSNPYDSKKITVTVNKNVFPTSTPETAVTAPVSTASPVSTPTAIGTPTVSPTILVVATPKPKTTPRSRPIASVTQTSVPTVSPTSPAATLRIPSPFPTLKPLPEKSSPQAQARRGVLENIWSFFRGLFF